MNTSTVLSIQTALYARCTNAETDGQKVHAAIRAINSTDLLTAGFSESSTISLDILLENPPAILRALSDLGELDDDQQQDFGINLAEALLDNDLEDQVAAAKADYNAESFSQSLVSDGADAYEINDPKHPNYMDYLDLGLMAA